MSYPMDEDPVMEEESRHAVADVGAPVGPDPSGSPIGFEPSPKLRARIEKLAHWRIDSSSIRFQHDRVSHGGHATVSKGAMNLGHVDIPHLEKRARDKNVAIDDFLEKRERVGKLNVAVKEMRVADDTDFERALGLTIREAEFLAKLDHKNIVELEGLVEGVSKGTIWLVLTWAEYGNLKDFIARGKWHIPERISLINDVAKGLEYLHTRNPPVCHGDLKSFNVLIYGDSEYHGGWDNEPEGKKIYARITDFGSARRLPHRDPTTQIEEVVTLLPSAEPPSASFCASAKTITLTGNKYTLRWAAPELLLQDQLSLWSDIWALGWIAYEVMTGSLPFEDAASEMAVVERVLEGKLPALTDNADLLLIHELCSLMNMCWQIQPTQRPTADSCRRSIEKMPMLAPQMKYYERILDYERLRNFVQMYQSRGQYAKIFTLLTEALDHTTGGLQLEDRIQVLRDLAQLARIGKDYSKTIAVYDVIWEICEETVERHTTGLGDAFCDLAELHRLRSARGKTGELPYVDQDIQGERRIAEALCVIAEHHRIARTYNKAIQLSTSALEISTVLGDGKGRADALWGLAEARRSRCEYEEAIQLYSEVLKICTDLRDKEGSVSALWGLADVHRCGSKYEDAIPLYSELLKIYTDLGDRKGKASALWGLADVHRCRSEYDKAIPLYSKVLEIHTYLNHEEGRATALWGLADVHRRRGEYEKAIPLYLEVLEVRNDLRDEEGRADALWGLADVHRCQREYDKALPLYSEVLEIHTYLNHKEGRASALWGLADVHRRRGEYEKAIPLYAEALEVRIDLDDEEGRASSLWGLADVHRRRSEYEKAIPLYSELLKIRTDRGDRKGRVSALWGLADVHRRVSEYEKAIPLYSEVLEISTDRGDRKGRADALWGLADVHRCRSRYEVAIALYSEVLKIRTDLEDTKGIAEALWGLAEVHRLQREYEEASPLYYNGLGTRTGIDDRKGRTAALLGPADAHHAQRNDGDNLCQQVPEILEHSCTLADPTPDNERLVGLEVGPCTG